MALRRQTIAPVALAFLALVSFADRALAAGPAKKGPAGGKTAHVEREPAGRSVGTPTEGHLVDGVKLDEGPALRITPVYAAGDARYGTRYLVHLVDRASKRVKHQFPDAVLSVGHLSHRTGGEIDRHASHESGRDADLGFYVKSTAGKPLYAPTFVAFNGDGKAKAWPGAHFDDAKNWALVEALLTDAEARVSHIFVALPLRERLLAYAQRMNVREALRARAAEVMTQPKGALPHDDHFHVRISCPPHSEGCVENPALHKVAHGKPGKSGASAATGKKTAHSAPAHGRDHGRDAPAKHEPPKHEAPKHEERREADKPTPTKAPPKAEPKKSEKAEDETSVPKLGPLVPGLDSVVIPAPMDDVDGN